MNQIINPVSFPPLPDSEYQWRLEKNLQDMQLHDRTELREELNHQRALKRDEHKFFLKNQEYTARQKLKCKIKNMVLRGNAVYLQSLNGEGHVLSEQCIFSCTIKELRRYERVPEKKRFWQVILIDQYNNLIESPIYPDDVIMSISKLQTTIFLAYDLTASSEVKRMAWKWLQSQLINLCDQAEIKRIPSRGGWFEEEKYWKFFTSDNLVESLQNEKIKAFQVSQREAVKSEDVNQLVESCRNQQLCRKYGVLVLLRLAALLGRIIADEPLKLGTVLVGADSEKTASSLLSTTISDNEFINLDTDRISKIRKTILEIQDDSLIFICSYPNEKSSQNRIREILGWLQTGYIEGNSVSVPYIFCLKGFSKSFPLSDLIVIDVTNVERVELEKFLSLLQDLVVKKIEESGKHWVNRFRNSYTKYRESISIPIIAISKSIEENLLNMLSDNQSDNAVFALLNKLVSEGLEELVRQLLEHDGGLIEVFKDCVEGLVTNGKLQIENREQCSSSENEQVIFFDENYYYLTKECLQIICRSISVNTKSMLFLKQLLVELGYVKLYFNSGTHNRDLDIDFITWNSYGVRQKRSGIAIKKSFWDLPGGVSLSERSENDA